MIARIQIVIRFSRYRRRHDLANACERLEALHSGAIPPSGTEVTGCTNCHGTSKPKRWQWGFRRQLEIWGAGS